MYAHTTFSTPDKRETKELFCSRNRNITQYTFCILYKCVFRFEIPLHRAFSFIHTFMHFHLFIFYSIGENVKSVTLAETWYSCECQINFNANEIAIRSFFGNCNLKYNSKITDTRFSPDDDRFLSSYSPNSCYFIFSVNISPTINQAKSHLQVPVKWVGGGERGWTLYGKKKAWNNFRR